MLDLEIIVGFDWDQGNDRKSVDKHNASQREAEEVFFHEPLLTLPDHAHSISETSFHLLGTTNDGRRLHVTFTLRGQGTLIRIISARDMSARERAIYDEQA